MKTKQLGWTDLHISRVGLGTWAMGGGDWEYAWGDQDDARSRETVHHAVKLGINWIDTAPVYGLGHSESVVGAAVATLDPANKPILATKCSLVWDENRVVDAQLTPQSLRAEIEGSLRRLQVETIDLYQIHWPNPKFNLAEGWSTIADLVKEGKIRYAGVSNFNVEQMREIQAIHPIASLQPPYSMTQRGIEDEILGFCAANNIGVIVYSPMQKGLLTGKVSAEWVANLPENDHRKRDDQFREPELSINLALVDGLKGIAERNGRTLAQLAIAWTLHHPAVTAAIVGARRPDQIAETATAGAWELSETDAADIATLLAQRESDLTSIARE